jgi:hypothetical protein
VSVLRKTDLVQLAKHGIVWRGTSPKKYYDYINTTRVATCGSLWPCCYLNIGGIMYGLVIVDDYSCFTWVFFL